MLVHDSALCAVTVGKHDIMHVKKGRHTAQGRRPRQQFKSAIQEAIHRQFKAIRMFFGNSSLNRCYSKTEAILPAGSTPFKILTSGNQRTMGVCGGRRPAFRNGFLEF